MWYTFIPFLCNNKENVFDRWIIALWCTRRMKQHILRLEWLCLTYAVSMWVAYIYSLSKQFILEIWLFHMNLDRCRHIRMAVDSDVSCFQAELYDVISKNLEKVTNPKGEEKPSMYWDRCLLGAVQFYNLTSFQNFSFLHFWHSTNTSLKWLINLSQS